MVSLRVSFLWRLHFSFYFDFSCFGAIFNKTVIPLKLFRYEIISYLARATDIMVNCSLINLTGDFIFLFYFSFLYFGGIFNKTISPFALVRYEMIVVNDELSDVPRWLSSISYPTMALKLWESIH